MPDREERREHPVLAGLAVGLILGLSTLVGTRVLGVGESDGTTTSTARQSMYLPKPSETDAPSGPLITLAPGRSPSAPKSATDEPSESESAKEQISLSAGQTSVSAMQQIDLTGVYPGGEGAILQVQKFTGGSWADFPVTVSVSNETFATYVQTSQTGVNRFRVVDTDSGLESNEVRVTIG